MASDMMVNGRESGRATAGELQSCVTQTSVLNAIVPQSDTIVNSVLQFDGAAGLGLYWRSFRHSILCTTYRYDRGPRSQDPFAVGFGAEVREDFPNFR